MGQGSSSSSYRTVPYCTVLPRKLQMAHRRQDGMERWPETAPVSLSWVQSQNLGKSGDAWSRNGVPRDTNLRTGYPDPVPRIGTLSMAFFLSFSLSLFPAISFFIFQLGFFSFFLLRGRGTPLARTDQISVMPLGNSIINSHAKPGVNASTPRTLPLSQGGRQHLHRTKVIRTGAAEHRCERATASRVRNLVRREYASATRRSPAILSRRV
ncbi:hypothetical protein GGI35DRAFT_442623, partial [Trichoderma velutinum]